MAQNYCEEIPSYELAQCREQQALFFYFGQLQPRLKGYWTDELAQLYTKASPSSLLTKVVAAFTCSITSLHPHFYHVRPLAIGRYGECLQLVRAALKNPDSATTDETLAAVILLGTFEVSTASALLEAQSANIKKLTRSLALESPITYPHLPGALAIVKSRPRHSFRSQMAQKLLLHVNAENVRVIFICPVI